MRVPLIIFFIFIAFNGHSQESTVTAIHGKVDATAADLEGIYVINLNTEKSVITEKDGYFVINAKLGDTLIFSAVNLKEVRIPLKKEDFLKEILNVKMEATLYTLSEVVVKRYDNINAVALGIVPSGIKHLTPAERKYATASSGKLNPMGLDPLLNLISGRTAMLRKEIEVEKKERFMEQLDNMFDQNHFSKTWRIPLEYINGFKYYVVENERFTNVLKTKNKTSIEFLMGQLAVKYLEIINTESK